MPTQPVSPRHPTGSVAVRIFGRGLHITWLSIATITILLGIVPIPLMPPVSFYSYCAGKALFFALLGYATPLTFFRFDALNRGLLFAAASACLVETLQAVFGHGHSFHWYELLGKLVLILLGFALALSARYDREIALGVSRIQLLEYPAA